MSNETRCPRCGSPLESSGASCPHCLLAAAVKTPSTIKLGPGFLDDLPMPADKLVIADNYTVLETIARGGMGVVYKARQENLRRVVAVKMLLGGVHASDDYKRRFLQEAKAAAALNHPNIVAIHDWGEDSGQPFFSMEFIDGHNLAELAREQPMPPRAAAELLRTLAKAMQYAHSRGVLHRDLKPSNVLVNSASVPCITDFGLARDLNQETVLTASGDVLGTPGYLPPEQVSSRRGQIGPASDVYGLGAILYYLLTSRPPHLAGSVGEALRAVEESDPVSPRRLNPSVPEDLETICLKCLEKNPGRRYTTAEALADDLSHWLAGEPISARPVPAWERGWKWAKRRPAVASLAVWLVLAHLSALVGVTWLWRDAEAASRRARAANERLQLSKAEELFAAGKSRKALTSLAQGLRDNPKSSLLAPRLVSSLSSRPFCIPVAVGPPRAYSAEFAPDGATFLTDGNDVSISDSLTGERRMTLVRPGSIEPKKNLIGLFHPAGQQVVTLELGSGIIQIWAVADGRLVREFPAQSQQFRHLAINTDGDRLFVADSSNQVRVLRWDNGELVSTFSMSDEIIASKQISTDGKKFVKVFGAEKKVRFYSTETGKPLGIEVGHDDSDVAPVFSPDGHRFLTCDGGTIVIRDADSGRPLVTILVPPRPELEHEEAGRVRSLKFSPDGEWMMATRTHDLLVWDAHSGEFLCDVPELHHNGNHLYDAVFSADGRTIVTAWQNETVLYQFPGRPPVLSFPKITSGRFSADNHFAALDFGNALDLLNLSNGAIARLSPQPVSSVLDMAFQRGDRSFVAVCQDGTAWKWNPHNGNLLATYAWTNSPVDLAKIDRSGRRVLFGSAQGPDRVFDLESGRLISSRSDPREAAFAFSPDGRKIATFVDTSKSTNTPSFLMKVCDADTGRTLASSIYYFGRDAAFDPTSTRLGGTGDDKLLFGSLAWAWEISSAPDNISIFGSSTVPVAGFQFSPDGNSVSLGALDGTVRIHDLRNGRLTQNPLKHAGPVTDTLFSHDGGFLAVSAAPDLMVWDVSAGQPLTERTPVALGSERLWGSKGFRFIAADSGVLWETCLTDEPVPEWLPDLAEAFAGFSRNPEGLVLDEKTKPTNLTNDPVRERLLSLFWESPHQSKVSPAAFVALRKKLLVAPGSGFYQRWVAWLLSGPATRSVTPSLGGLRSSHVQNLIVHDDFESSVEAIRFDPTNGLARAALAKWIMKTTEENSHRPKGEAEWQSRRAVELAPHEPETWRVHADFFDSQGNVSKALEITERGLERHPRNVPLLQAAAKYPKATSERRGTP